MEKLIALLYGKKWIFRPTAFLFLKNPLFSRFVGWLASRKFSKRWIAPFIEKYGINVWEFEKRVGDFSSFQDFFIRRLKKGARPISSEDIVSPADGTISIYPDLKRDFLIKEKSFSLENFFQDRALADEFKNGSMCVIRLDVFDYHHFHFPFDALPSTPRLINGYLYSVRPEAIKRNINIWAENKRSLTILESPLLGRSLFIAIGATAVGTIKESFQPGLLYKKGDEMGYFALGGSSIALIFKEKLSFRKNPRILCGEPVANR